MSTTYICWHADADAHYPTTEVADTAEQAAAAHVAAGDWNGAAIIRVCVMSKARYDAIQAMLTGGDEVDDDMSWANVVEVAA